MIEASTTVVSDLAEGKSKDRHCIRSVSRETENDAAVLDTRLTNQYSEQTSESHQPQSRGIM